MREVKIKCDHCGETIGNIRYDFSIQTKTSYRVFYACSEECFKNLLHKIGIATYPTNNAKKSLEVAKTAFVISILALMVEVVRTISVSL